MSARKGIMRQIRGQRLMLTAPGHAEIGAGFAAGKDVRIGYWTKIARDVVIGDRVRLGDHTRVGAGSQIGNDVHFGEWASIGAGVKLGDGVWLGAHTRIQDGVTVSRGRHFEPHDLVTRDGVIKNRCSGYAGFTLMDEDAVCIQGPFGSFVFPGMDAHDDFETLDEMIDAYQWGRNDDLDAYRLPEGIDPVEDAGRAVEAVLARLEAAGMDIPVSAYSGP